LRRHIDGVNLMNTMTSRWQAFQSELATLQTLMLGPVPTALARRWRPGIGMQAAYLVPRPVNDRPAWNWYTIEPIRWTAERR
jgi:hypothetical protein